MLFTVFQYVPILEEETPGHKVELTKKNKQNDLADGDDADEDCDDDDSEQEICFYYSSTYPTNDLRKKQRFPNGNDLYKYRSEHLDTPPPKV